MLPGGGSPSWHVACEWAEWKLFRCVDDENSLHVLW